MWKSSSHNINFSKISSDYFGAICTNWRIIGSFIFMRRYLQYEPFNVYCFDADTWTHPVHKHSYFEIIFIREGLGKHYINGNEFSYKDGDIFLLGHEDYHYFKIEQHTCFNYIRFTEVFIKQGSSTNQQDWLKTIELLLNTPYQSNGSGIRNEPDKALLDHLLTVLIAEYNNKQHGFFEAVMDGLMKAILSIIARNLIKEPAQDTKEVTSSLFDLLLVQIRTNICVPENLRIEHLAETFHYSASYLSTYFKKQAGESLQQYILKYKLKQVENRLKHSEHTISQIAHEFGFSDESHFNKTFKKHYGVGPRDYRKQIG